MRRPRRIFRGSGVASRSTRQAGRSTLLVGLAAIGTALLVMLAGRPGDLFGRVPTLTGTISAEPHAVAVVDGDTLRLHETVIRLQGVQAPPRGATCRTADGTGYDCGTEAAAALGRLVRGLPVACRLDGRDLHGMPQGQCDAGGTGVNRAIVAAGWARAANADGTDGSGLAEAERRARTAMLGVWRGAADPFL